MERYWDTRRREFIPLLWDSDNPEPDVILPPESDSADIERRDAPPYIVVRKSHSHDLDNTYDTCRSAGHKVMCCHYGTDQDGHIKTHNGHWASDAACVESKCFAKSGRCSSRRVQSVLTDEQRTSTGRAASRTRGLRTGRTAAPRCTTSPGPETRSRSAVPKLGLALQRRSTKRNPRERTLIESRRTLISRSRARNRSSVVNLAYNTVPSRNCTWVITRSKIQSANIKHLPKRVVLQRGLISIKTSMPPCSGRDAKL